MMIISAKREPSSSSDEYELEDKPQPSSSTIQPPVPVIRPPSSSNTTAEQPQGRSKVLFVKVLLEHLIIMKAQ